jgi:hypothetical protein
MVRNKERTVDLANLGIRLANLWDNPLKTKGTNPSMVADAVRVEPVSASKFPDMRESAGYFCNLQGI